MVDGGKDEEEGIDHRKTPGNWNTGSHIKDRSSPGRRNSITSKPRGKEVWPIRGSESPVLTQTESQREMREEKMAPERKSMCVLFKDLLLYRNCRNVFKSKVI